LPGRIRVDIPGSTVLHDPAGSSAWPHAQGLRNLMNDRRWQCPPPAAPYIEVECAAQGHVAFRFCALAGSLRAIPAWNARSYPCSVSTSRRGLIMSRKYIDCREFPSDTHCSVAIAADSEEELLEAAVQHAVAVHRHQDSPELRQQIRQLFKEGTPPVERPAVAAV
jgi:predicted small metal-binding protein